MSRLAVVGVSGAIGLALFVVLRGQARAAAAQKAGVVAAPVGNPVPVTPAKAKPKTPGLPATPIPRVKPAVYRDAQGHLRDAKTGNRIYEDSEGAVGPKLPSEPTGLAAAPGGFFNYVWGVLFGGDDTQAVASGGGGVGGW